MPTVSQALIIQNKKLLREPKSQLKRPRIPRVAELSPKMNTNSAEMHMITGDNKRHQKYASRGRKDVGHARSASTTRDSYDVSHSEESLHRQNYLDNPNYPNKAEDADSKRYMYMCKMSDGSHHIMGQAEFDQMTLTGELPETKINAVIPVESDGYRLAMEAGQGMNHLPRMTSDAIQASHLEAAQMQHYADHYLSIQGSEKQMEPGPWPVEKIQRQNYPQVPETTWTKERFDKQPLDDKSLMKTTAHQLSAQYHPSRIPSANYKITQQTTTEQKGVFNDHVKMNNHHHHPSIRYADSSSKQQQQQHSLLRQQTDIAPVPVSIVPNMSQFPTPPKDPTHPAELNLYHAKVEAFLKHQEEYIKAQSYANKVHKANNKASPNTTLQETTLTPPIMKQPDKGFFYNMLSRLSDGKAGYKGLLGCMSTES